MSELDYHYHHQTRLFTHSVGRVPDPKKEGAFLPVLNATSDPLPELSAHQAARRTDDDSSWEIVDDYRGTVWNTTTKQPETYEKTGPLPADLTHLEPGPFDQWQNGAWVKDAEAELNNLRAKAANAVRQAFATAAQQPAPAQSTTWNGGMDSALALDGAVRLAEQAGATQINLYDADNAEHIVDIATGRIIAAAVASAYQTQLQRKQQLLRDIKTANADQLNSLVWTD